MRWAAVTLMLAVLAGATPCSKCKYVTHPKTTCQPLQCVAPSAGASQLPTLRGGFVELRPGVKGADWRAIARSMTCAGMDTLIIQAANDLSATKAILAGVARHNDSGPGVRLKVYVGMKYEAFTGSKAATDLTGDVSEDVAVASTVAGLNLPFDGWYIAREFYNFNDTAYAKLLRDHYVVPLAKTLREKWGKSEILVSPYFNPACGSGLDLADPAATARIFTTLFGAARVHVLLQDGMGAKNHGRHCFWADQDYWPQMAAYEAALRRTLGERAWVNAESFEKVVPGSDPSTTWLRLERQLRTVPTATRVVTFDYYLNMNPVNGTPDAKRLYRDYVIALGKQQACSEFLSQW